MVALYAISILVATTIAMVALRRKLGGLALFTVALAACNGPGPDGTGGSGTGGGAPTTSTVTETDQCNGACVAPQICAIGCGESIGCYTPGGTLTNPTPNDCPACFPMPAGSECDNSGFPLTFFCQAGAKDLGGCVKSTTKGYQCCPPPPDAG
jgi:hypothetical protein